MILPAADIATSFPDDTVSEAEKLTPEWGRKAGRALYSRWWATGSYFSYSGMSAMQTRRNYGAGMQDNAKYINQFTNGSAIGVKHGHGSKGNNQPSGTQKKDRGGSRKGFANISYDPLTPMAKLSNVVLSLLSTNDYKVDCVSIDKNVLASKKAEKDRAIIRAKLTNPLRQSIGLPVSNQPFNPENEDELVLWEKLGYFKAKTEIALEKISEIGFRTSNWKGIRPIYNRDAFDQNFRIVRTYVDPDSKLTKVEYVDPCNVIMLWNEHQQSEPVGIGVINSVSIQSIYGQLMQAGFTESQIQAMAQQQTGIQTADTCTDGWIFERKDPTTNRWLWLDYKVWVLQFEYWSTDYSMYAERETPKGTSYEKVKNPKKFKDKNPNAVLEETRCDFIYEGNYIVSTSGMDMIYGWRKKPNQMRKGLKPLSSFVFDRILGQSMTGRVMGLLDDLTMYMYKLRAAVAAAAPKGYTIDIATAGNVTIGGKEYDPFDLIHIHRQNGIRIVSTRFNAVQGKFNADIFKTDDNGLGPQGLEWIQQIVNTQNLILEALGISEVMAAMPNQSGERLPGVVQADMEATINSMWFLKESEQRFKEKVAERIILQTRINIEYDPAVREAYENLIGKDLIKALDDIEGLTLDKMGITSQALPTEKEKAAIMLSAENLASKPTSDGTFLMSASGLTRVRQLLKNDDIDEAILFMAKEEQSALRKQKEHAAAMQEMSIQGAQQTALVAEEAKRQTAKQMAEIDIYKETQLANINIRKEVEIQRMKNDGAYEVQLLKGVQRIDEIEKEATLESQLQVELNGIV